MAPLSDKSPFPTAPITTYYTRLTLQSKFCHRYPRQRHPTDQDVKSYSLQPPLESLHYIHRGTQRQIRPLHLP
ncbi:hypothetical protein SESBI_14822 [Sesbania bispinosa]|nr:hypothetical protein SESBI_14822 [Sesbania bispinosa]